MNNLAFMRRRTCLGLAMGLVADTVFATGLLQGDSPLRYRTVHDFTGPDGGISDAGLIIASDGNAYGTCGNGGDFDDGTVFRLTPGKQVKVLHSFSGRRRDGGGPVSALVEANGALYGVTTAGGSADGGVAFRAARDGGSATIHEFGVDPHEGHLCWAGLTLASDGMLYGATYFGGDSGGGVVYRMDTDGNVTPLWPLGSGADPSTPLAAPIEAADGRMVGSGRAGGAHNHGAIYSMAKDGSDRQILHSYSGNDGSDPSVPLTQALDGNFYGITTFGGPNDGGTVFRVAPDGTFALLHAFSGAQDGREPNTSLLEYQPGVFIGTTTFGGRFGAGVIFMIDADGSFTRLHTFGGTVHGVPDGQRPSGDLLLVRPGHVAGTCRGGGASDQGTIWALVAEPA
jgi:uncharacterized repeat protein (TIGR03803 family)